MHSRRPRTATLALCLFGTAIAVLSASPASAQAGRDVFLSCTVSKTESTGFKTTATGMYLSGNVWVKCDDTEIFADEAITNDAEGKMEAKGHVTFVQPGVRITAARIELNRKSQLGIFYDADGLAQITNKQPAQSLFGTLEPEVHFWAKKLERIGNNKYKLTDGGFTTCVQPTERWTMVGNTATVVLDEHIFLRNAVFRVKNVPLGYLPILYYPIGEKDRSTGLLIPSYTASTLLGHGISNAFFWAINRSMDATLYHTYYSRAGNSVSGEFRYAAAPGSDGGLRIDLQPKPQVQRGGVAIATERDLRLIGNLNQGVGGGFRVIGNVNYFTSLISNQLYQQNLEDLSRRSRDLNTNISGNIRRARIDAGLSVNDYINNSVTSRNGRAPGVTVTFAEKPIGRSRVYVGATGDASQTLSQSNLAIPATDLGVARFDVRPTISATLSSWPFLSVKGNAVWRGTYWNERLDPATRTKVAEPVSRLILDLGTDVTGPTIARVFAEHANGTRYKHLIEPRVSLRWISPFDKQSLIIPTGIDNQITGTTTVSYGVVNRVLVRKKRADGVSMVREALAVNVSQSYFTDATAALRDPNANIATAFPFTALQFDVVATPTDEFRARFIMALDAKYKQPQTYLASATWTRGLTQVSATWSKRQFIPGSQAFPQGATSHALTTSVAMRERDGRLNGRYDIQLDLKQHALMQQRIVLGYNTQCCGIAVDYSALKASSNAIFQLPANRTFNLTFTLAGIGSFANPLGAFGNNTVR